MDIKQDLFGRTAGGKDIYSFVLSNNHGMSVEVINYGATVRAVNVPDKSGKVSDVILGYDNLAGYENGNSFFGVTAGRYCNRIAGGKFSIEGTSYQLSINDGVNQLHGGKIGFGKVVWEVTQDRLKGLSRVVMEYNSPDGEEGFPGNLKARVIYSLTDNNELVMEYWAQTDKPTHVNLTNHNYYNFGTGNILGHELMIDADSLTSVGEGLIPTGILMKVKGTAFDFTKPSLIGSRIEEAGGGYDHNFVLNNPGLDSTPQVVLSDRESGRIMELTTTEVGVQFYSGQFGDVVKGGKNGSNYGKYCGLCLEPQHYPDSPNRPEFPSTLLKPGETYKQATIYRFRCS